MRKIAAAGGNVRLPLDFWTEIWYSYQAHIVRARTHICSGIEVVITGLTRNQFASNRTWVRIPPAAPKQEATAFAVAFCFGTHCPKGGSTLRDSNARGGRAAPAPRFLPAVKTARTAHSRRRPEGPLEPATLSSIQNIDFTVSLSSEGPLWMSFVFSCLRGKRAHEPQIPNICIQTSYKGINSSLFEWTHSLLPGEG